MVKRYTPIDVNQWMDNIAKVRNNQNNEIITQAIELYPLASQPTLKKGVGIADLLFSMGLDNETLAAAIAYPALQAKEVHWDHITEKFGEGFRKLLFDAMQMQSLDKFQKAASRDPHQIENLRKMVLAMVTDVRAILLILAERLWQLRQAKEELLPEQQKKLAQETLNVYAPLANRLGVWQLKWEMEDLCLRYLQPEIYSTIAKGIASRRADREEYIQRVIKLLTDLLQNAGIKNFQVNGRVKHIYSIYKKMQRKSANLEEIYDMSALRVLVEKEVDCYAVLSILNNEWQQIPDEFDDYIAHPKPNGYRSIHTVFIGPESHIIEVQIRTYEMHKESELGVAAHWRYKEGVLQPTDYEAKIALLRQIMAWQKELASPENTKSEQIPQDLFANQIYVFTPMGDIIDLPKKATPIDFAYHIHSEVGHRCRGAKVNGNIVPLTYQLQTGDRVEILTSKKAAPSRDWINPHLGYINTSRARAKAQHWFRIQNSMQSTEEERIKTEPVPLEKEIKKIEPTLPTTPIRSATNSNVLVLGVENLLSHIALCCKPLPGDKIVGYLSRHRGVSVHRYDCYNITPIMQRENNRIVEVEWGTQQKRAYQADLELKLNDAKVSLRDISNLLGSEKINVLALRMNRIKDSDAIDIHLTIEVANREQFKKAIQLLKQLPNLLAIKRL